MSVVNHVGQCVTDLERATRFWCDVLGFEVDRPDLHIPDGIMGPMFGVEGPAALTARYLRCGDYVHELIWFDRPTPAPARRAVVDPGLTHVSVCVDDVAATLVPLFVDDPYLGDADHLVDMQVLAQPIPSPLRRHHQHPAPA